MTQGIYINQRFDEKQTLLLEKTAGPSVQIFDFLSDEEFNFLRNISLSDDIVYPEIGKVSKYWGFGPQYKPADEINDWLIPKIEKYIGPCNIDFYAFQEAIIPWKIHADIRWDEVKVPYKVMLIPLDVEPNDGKIPVDKWPSTATITFNQRNYMRELPSKDGKQIIPNTGQDHWLRSCDDPCVEGLVEGYSIEKDIWNNFLTHVPYDHLEGLTIDRINYWVPKSIMYWDNTALHAADDFLSHGIKTKRCFMIFTYL